jgi:hypothetical protein
MTTPEFIIALFYAVDQEMLDVPTHPEATLYPSAVVMLALLHAIKGGWDPRLLSLANARLSAIVSPGAGAHLLGTALQDAHGVDRPVSGCPYRARSGGHLWHRVHPPEAGRAPPRADREEGPEQSSVDGQWELCFSLNQGGLICAWDCATANVHDTHVQPLIVRFDGQRIVLTDTGFHAQTGDPANMQVCPRGTWHTRMLVETVLSMLTTVFQSKKVGHRVGAYFRARLAWTMAAFNLLVRWGLAIDDEHMVRLSIAEFSL